MIRPFVLHAIRFALVGIEKYPQVLAECELILESFVKFEDCRFRSVVRFLILITLSHFIFTLYFVLPSLLRCWSVFYLDFAVEPLWF